MEWLRGGGVCGCAGVAGGGIGIGICICTVWADSVCAAKRAEQAPRVRPRKVRRVLMATPYESMAESTEGIDGTQISFRGNCRERRLDAERSEERRVAYGTSEL